MRPLKCWSRPDLCLDVQRVATSGPSTVTFHMEKPSACPQGALALVRLWPQRLARSSSRRLMWLVLGHGLRSSLFGVVAWGHEKTPVRPGTDLKHGPRHRKNLMTELVGGECQLRKRHKRFSLIWRHWHTVVCRQRMQVWPCAEKLYWVTVLW